MPASDDAWSSPEKQWVVCRARISPNEEGDRRGSCMGRSSEGRRRRGYAAVGTVDRYFFFARSAFIMSTAASRPFSLARPLIAVRFDFGNCRIIDM